MTSNSRDRICIYDGIDLFVLDPAFRQHVLNNSSRYRLQGNFDYESETLIGTFSGRFRNFDIRTAANSRGSGIVLGGSLHKWKNRTHNHDTFLMNEFEEVYYEMLNEFKFSPLLTDIWSLEGGINNVLPDHWTYRAKAFPQNTILLKGDPKSSHSRKQPKGGFSLDVQKGECKNKMYDKGSQFELPYEVLRTECSCKKRPLMKCGINNFQDLLDDEKHFKFSKHLLKAFDTLLLFQPEILQHPSLSPEDRLFVLEYNNSNAWIKLRRESDYQYQKSRKRYLILIDKFCEVNYQRELLKQMNKQLN